MIDRQAIKQRAELTKLGFSRQANRKADEGSKHPDRVVPKARFQHDAQFEHINANVVAAQAAGQPVISVDTRDPGHRGDFSCGSKFTKAPVWLAQSSR